jgi:GT2 family glycosyltransferase
MTDGGAPAGPARIAVVTASRGRPDALLAKARSLAEQTLPPEAFEWCLWLNETPERRDRTRALLAELAPAFALRVGGGVDHPVGRARNLAAAMASAPVLLLSDDDVTHDPSALEAHVAFHQRVPGAVGVGSLRLPEALRDGRRREPFERTAGAFGRAHWSNATGANSSLPRTAFDAVGGYDPEWRGYGGEDPELALRLRAHGLVFRRVPAGGAEHRGRVWDDADKAYRAGRAHVRVARRHPHGASAWWLGVHPALLAVKRIALYGPWSRWIDQAVLAYERAYARGARDARREAAA